MRKNHKPIMIYLTDEEHDKMQELKKRFSSDAITPGTTAIVRLALETLYNQVKGQSDVR